MTLDRRHRVARALVRGAAPLVPAGLRDDWRREWLAELAALADVPPRFRRPIRRALGAFTDAFWLRQQSVADFDWIDDMRVGWRQLAQHRSFALTAVAILALGLGAALTVHSVATQVLLRPLPYPDPSGIVTLWETRAPDHEPLDVAPGNFLDWRQRATAFEHLAGVEPWALDVAGDPRPEVWFAARVTDGFFEAFGVRPLLGRFFAPEDYTAGRNGIAVLGEAFWRRRFGGDPTVIGRTVRVDDTVITIVGIAPATFEPRLLATATGHRDVWMPKAIESYEPNIRGSGYWAVVGRLRPGTGRETAQAELDAISHQLAVEYPRTNEKTGATLRPLRDHLVGNVELALALLAAAVGIVLLIACVNVANLLLARGAAREREMAIRVALGAGRGRLVQQLLVESLVIAGLGAAGGGLVASWALAATARLGPASVPWIDTLHLDGRSLAFGAGMAVVVAILSGLLPALRVARSGLASAGRPTATADAAQHRLRTGLVIAEIALALVLVCGAGLLLRSFIGLVNVDPGFQRDRILAAQVFAWDYSPTPAARRTFFATTIDRLAALPAVQHVGAVSAMPFIESNINIEASIAIAGRPPVTQGEAPRSHLTVATPGYFAAMRIPLLAGRLLEARDGPDAKRVALISETLARRYWPPGDDPIGDTVRFRFSGTPTEVEIVGIVGSLRHDRLDRSPRDELFMPHAQAPSGSMTFVVRSAGDATALLEPARAAIWSVSPAQTIYRSATLDELVGRTISPRRFALAVVIGFAAVALLLAVTGVYGVLSAIMTARLREIGLRVALGARRRDIVGLVMTHGAVIAFAGLVIGLAAALGAARMLRSFLFGIAPGDPVAIALSAALMLLAALAACWVPARRAAAADPIALLRAD